MPGTGPADLAIRDAHIFYRGRLLKGHICISEGLISYIGKGAGAPGAVELLDARGLLALPGPIDAHVHLRDEGLAHKEDFYTGTCSAVAGGITTVLDMPNTVPPVDSASRLVERARKAQRAIVANVGFYALFPDSLEGLKGLAEAGAVGLKVYLHQPKTKLDLSDAGLLREAVLRANELGLPVAFHAEDPGIISRLSNQVPEEVGPVEAFLRAHPPEAEVEAIRTLSDLLSGLKVHICHVSTPEGLGLAKGAGFTVEATPHHLFLDASYYGAYGPLALMDPPLRPRELVEGLRKALYSGMIDIVASDHAPHALEEKEGPSPPPGIPGLETLLPLLLNEVSEKRLSLQGLIKLVCEGPARIFGLDRGSLDLWRPADLVLVDLKAEKVVRPADFKSKAKYSPFKGLRLKGVPVFTIVNGHLAFAEGEVVAEPGCGSIVRPNRGPRGRDRP